MRPSAIRSAPSPIPWTSYGWRVVAGCLRRLGLVVCTVVCAVAMAQTPMPTPPVAPQQVGRVRAIVASCKDRFKETPDEAHCVLSQLTTNELHWCLFPPPNGGGCFQGDLLAQLKGSLEQFSANQQSKSYKPGEYKFDVRKEYSARPPTPTAVQPHADSPKPASALPATVPTPHASEPQSTALTLAAETKTIDSLVTGSAAVSAPTNATEGTPFSVYLRVSPEALEAVLESLAKDVPENATRAGRSEVKLTPRMTATLTGL